MIQALKLPLKAFLMGQLQRDNRYDRMTDSFQKLVGRPPISTAEFVRRNAAAFTPLKN